MNSNFRNFAFTLTVVLSFLSFQTNATAQNKKLLSSTEAAQDNIFMTWNKNTPEQEMKDDCKALAEKGITIKYSNVKRNSSDEIIALRVEYSDRKGNKGVMELNNQKPINTIKFFRQDDEIGFGDPSSSNPFGGNPLMNGFAGGDDLMKQFRLDNEGGDAQSFSFSFPDGANLGESKSKMIIKKQGKKPLVIDNGEVVEGGDDYSTEELEEIKKSNKFESSEGLGNHLNDKAFDFRNQEGLDNFKKQMDEMQSQMDKMTPNSSEKATSEFNKTKEELLKAKEEMVKAKEELEKARKELEKTKSTLKTSKA
jgi:hypothetical protein